MFDFFISLGPGIFPLRYGLYSTKVEWIVTWTLVMSINLQLCIIIMFVALEMRTFGVETLNNLP